MEGNNEEGDEDEEEEEELIFLQKLKFIESYEFVINYFQGYGYSLVLTSYFSHTTSLPRSRFYFHS